MPTAHHGSTNHLITRLPKNVQKDILSQCETVELTFGDVLYDAEQTFDHAYFPVSGFISLLATLDDHEPLEMGLIGNEGMFGATLAFDVDITTMQSLVQGSGEALRIPVPRLRELLRKYPALQKLLSRYLYVLSDQLVQSAACTYFHEIDARLARWLLMSHDRAQADTLQLTHKFLARMLGVRRSGVTIAAGNLQEKGLVNYTRGQIAILNRKGLEAIACPCYRKMQKVYAQNLPA